MGKAELDEGRKAVKRHKIPVIRQISTRDVMYNDN